LYLLAARRIAVAPDRCLVFEDSAPGATAGLAAGMGVVIVPDLKRPSDDVCEAASMVLPSLQTAIEHCAAWFGR
jgi:beta-phosphoglucomutase-like phosphatase (HAD superfamily)